MIGPLIQVAEVIFDRLLSAVGARPSHRSAREAVRAWERNTGERTAAPAERSPTAYTTRLLETLQTSTNPLHRMHVAACLAQSGDDERVLPALRRALDEETDLMTCRAIADSIAKLTGERP